MRRRREAEQQQTGTALPANTSFSESLQLFQSLQVLANEEEVAAFRNETAASKFVVLVVSLVGRWKLEGTVQ